MELSGNTILITGGGSGIGLAAAKLFLSEGNEVIICGRDAAKLERAVVQNPNLKMVVCDIRNAEHVAALHAQIGERVNVLVNNAAISLPAKFIDQSGLARQVNEIDINLVGPLRVLNAFLPTLAAKSEAAVVNVTSALAFMPSAISPIYSATKAALHSLTMSLRHQMRDTSVKVFELIPPLTDTPMAARMSGVPKLSPEFVAEMLLKAMANDDYEITPGMSRMAKLMSRIAPGFAFAQLNKSK